MARFAWVCDGCGKPVRDGDGYIEADYLVAFERMRKALDQHRERAASGELVISMADIMVEHQELGPEVQWQVWHRRCDPLPDNDTYWFAVERCRDLEDLLEWNAHLADKNWLEHTNWFRFIQRRLAPNAVQRKMPPPAPKSA